MAVLPQASRNPLALTALFLGILIGLGFSACSGKKCSPSNCTTCCNADGVCVVESSSVACGSGGNVCAKCSSSQSCISGTCVASDGSGGGSGACFSQGKCTKPDGTCGEACTSGCCIAGDPNGACSDGGMTVDHCGSRARTCTACGADQVCTEVLNGGACVKAQSDVFKECTQDSDCSSLGPQAICKKKTSSGSEDYPKGYCTTLCGSAGLPLCPGDSVCVGGADELGEADPFCWKKCDTDLDCRGGTDYLCYWSGSENLGCWLKPRAAPAGIPGKACTQSSECGPPPDFAPFCEPAALSDGGITGFLGGSCMVDCSFLLDEQCGPTGLCIPFSSGNTQRYFCQASCTAVNKGRGDPQDGGCREGYVCRGFASTDGGFEPTGYCARDCNNPVGDGTQKVGCGAGFTCRSDGYCCSGDAGCY